MADELEPCPFCGNDTVHVHDNYVGGRGFMVMCGSCTAEGPLCNTEGAAASEWNRRAAPIAAQLDQDAERERGQRENAEFAEWWNRAQACPEHNLITENAAHAAWQERARRAAQLDAELPPPKAPANEYFSDEPVYSKPEVKQIVAQYAERIRLLERAAGNTIRIGSRVYTAEQIDGRIRELMHDLDVADKLVANAGREIEAARIDGRTAGTASDAWISVADHLPEAGELVLVYSPPTKYDHPGEVNITFDCIDPDADDPSWLNHNEHYEHFCCVAKPEGSVGPSEHAPYTHWKRVAAPSHQENTND